MKYAIDEKIIQNFRNKVNGNANFVFQTYKDRNGSNHWNIICSCMDWINVAVSNLKKIEISDRDQDLMAMNVFSYISLIDIVFESIKQLHRVIISNSSIPFAKSKHIFTNNEISDDDNDYFKELRAAFGAHPVNLRNKKGKWYASWPTNHLSSIDYDFHIQLYSEKTNTPDLKLGLKFTELKFFLNERYFYLNHLSEIIDNQFITFQNKFKAKKIKNSDIPTIQLKYLEKESCERLNIDYYNYTIQDLIQIYSCNLNNENLKDKEVFYKKELLKLIQELKEKLQTMDLSDLKYDHILNPTYNSSLTYIISKLYSSNFDQSKDPLMNYYINEINKFSNNMYEFHIDQPKEELFLKTKLMLYFSKK